MQRVAKRIPGGDGFERTFDYDTARRPVTITTKVPKADGAASSDPAFRTFTVKNAYDQNYGRLKSLQYPGATGTGEIVALQYSDRGFPLGERELPADWDLIPPRLD